MKKIKYIFLLICSVCLIWLSPTLTRADSGWDFDYDSGGDSWDSSDYDYDSSWSSDWSSSGSNSGDLSFKRFIELVIIIVVICEIISYLNKNKNKFKETSDVLYDELSLDELNKYGIDKDAFIKEIYDKYVKVQESWMNFNFDEMKMLVTDELFNSYSSQLKVLKLKNQKNIMKDFEFVSGKITNIKDENRIRSVSVCLDVKQYDYVVDKDEKVVRGSSSKKRSVTYELIFVKSINETDEVICPNCGAKSNVVAGDNCEYCHSKIVIPPKEYVLSKKRVINQK